MYGYSRRSAWILHDIARVRGAPREPEGGARAAMRRSPKRTCGCTLTGQNNGQARTTARIPTTYHRSLLLRCDLDLASVLTEINSAAAKAGSVLADAWRAVFFILQALVS